MSAGGWRLPALLLALPLLGGCAVSTGFKGPGYDRSAGVTAPGEGPVVVALTRATLHPGGTGRSRFRAGTADILDALPDQPGVVGWSVRRTLEGSTAWTMTVWQDEASLKAFLRSPAHRSAVTASLDAVSTAVFARIPVERNRIPLSWEEALAILEREGYSYQ